jgi:hypothetical protein
LQVVSIQFQWREMFASGALAGPGMMLILHLLCGLFLSKLITEVSYQVKSTMLSYVYHPGLEGWDFDPGSLWLPRGRFGHKKSRAAFNIVKRHFRQPGCLYETQWAFRPTLTDGLVFSCIY